MAKYSGVKSSTFALIRYGLMTSYRHLLYPALLSLAACQSSPPLQAFVLEPAALSAPATAATATRTVLPTGAQATALVGKWRLTSATSDNATINGLGVKTQGFAQLGADGTGQLDMTAKLGFISRTRKAQFTWRQEGQDLVIHEQTKDHPTTWKVLSLSEQRMEAEVPSGKQMLRMVFVRE
jgi:hypothetical protein